MKHIEVALHRVAVGGSIRVVINGGRPSYLSEREVRDRLNGQPRLDAERMDDIVRNLNRNGGEHTLEWTIDLTGGKKSGPIGKTDADAPAKSE